MADAVAIDLTLTDDSEDEAPPSKVPRLREDERISAMRGGGETAHEREEGSDTPSPPPPAPAKSDGGDGGELEEELELVGETGLDWRRDLPHARSLCREHPFEAQNFRGHANALSCDNCWCFVCDVKAEQCTKWCRGRGAMNHCNAVDSPEWKSRKLVARAKRQLDREGERAGVARRRGRDSARGGGGGGRGGGHSHPSIRFTFGERGSVSGSGGGRGGGGGGGSRLGSGGGGDDVNGT